MFRSIPLKYVLPLLGLTVSAFIFNTSEFMPIGLLMDISQSFAMTESQTGIMITVYAWVVALLSCRSCYSSARWRCGASC